mmetsp:Transcript_20947/g.37708  ORF Transcript_20947/g.37708 Transcript_20947/m.37708 type:complete len:211 (-) Transcript_20947:366-998(-)
MRGPAESCPSGNQLLVEATRHRRCQTRCSFVFWQGPWARQLPFWVPCARQLLPWVRCPPRPRPQNLNPPPHHPQPWSLLSLSLVHRAPHHPTVRSSHGPSSDETQILETRLRIRQALAGLPGGKGVLACFPRHLSHLKEAWVELTGLQSLESTAPHPPWSRATWIASQMMDFLQRNLLVDRWKTRTFSLEEQTQTPGQSHPPPELQWTVS